ncbi:MAG: hypothetical protein AAGE92_12000 [Cyanobacteria bacterium P01_G01_bin.4]
MQTIFKSILFLLPVAFTLPAIAQEPLPDGAIQTGSLANQTLIQDTLIGIAAKTATLGCDAPEQVSPYVTQLPSGEEGSRVWRELWVVEGCNQEFPINIRFNEDGPNAADWTIVD